MSTDGAAAPSSGPRALGFWMCLALCVGNLIGSGVYLLPASLAPLGANALIGWAVTIAGAMALAVMFARLVAALPLAGGPCAYATRAFGPAAGFVVAWAYWAMIWVGNAALAVAVVSNLSLIAPGIGAVPGLAALLSVGTVWLLTLVNLRGAVAAGRMQVATTILKLLPLALVVLLAAWLLERQGGAAIVPQPAVPLGLGAVGGAVALTFWGFLGLESATVPAEKVTDAARIVPRATLWGTALTGAVYILVCGAVAAFMPAGQVASSPSPVADFLGRTFGGGTANVVALFAAISALGTLNGFVMLQGEVPWAMARSGVFPAWFGANDRRGTPVRALILSSVLLSVVTLMNYSRSLAGLFTFIALVSIAAGLVAYLACAAAALKLLPGDRTIRVIAPLAGLYTLWALWGVGREAIGWGAVLMAAGLPVYLSTRRRGAYR